MRVRLLFRAPLLLARCALGRGRGAAQLMAAEVVGALVWRSRRRRRGTARNRASCCEGSGHGPRAARKGAGAARASATTYFGFALYPLSQVGEQARTSLGSTPPTAADERRRPPPSARRSSATARARRSINRQKRRWRGR